MKIKHCLSDFCGLDMIQEQKNTRLEGIGSWSHDTSFLNVSSISIKYTYEKIMTGIWEYGW